LTNEASRINSPSMPAQQRRIPVINVTDLYHPPQDPGDNFDLIARYSLPEVELKAVLLDVTGAFRKPVSDHPILSKFFVDKNGPREPGVIPVIQLNAIFGKDVQFAVGPFSSMNSPADKMLDLPAFQQQGIDLILRTLRESQEPVEIASFGSARAIAVAYNREPALFRRRVRQIHLSAGASSLEFLEWNVALDPHPIVCLLRSSLPIAVYPCATKDGAFAYGPHNTYWKLPNVDFIDRMYPQLRQYLGYALGRVQRTDFLRVLEESFSTDFIKGLVGKSYNGVHNVWETAVWMQISRRCLVQRANGHFAIIPQRAVRHSDKVLKNQLRPCLVEVRDDGQYRFELVSGESNFLIYERGDPTENEMALREALPEWYVSVSRSLGVPAWGFVGRLVGERDRRGFALKGLCMILSEKGLLVAPHRVTEGSKWL
jgi:pyrimidine-specific ribonucleoside hydrolase